MAITAFTSGAIIDATAIGKTVLTASSEGVAADAIGLGSSDSPTFVDGSFSGNLNTELGGTQRVYGVGTDGDANSEYIETSWDGTTAKIQTKETGTGVLRKLDVLSGVTGMKAYANSTLILSSAWSSVTMNNVSVSLVAPTNGYVAVRKGDLRPYDAVTPINCGQPAVPWAGVYSVDGSFSGNLVSEVGGSYKLYNLGDESATDTEFLDVKFTSNVAFIGTQKTGTGATRGLAFQTGGNNGLYMTASTVFVYRTFLPSGNRLLGASSARWSGIYGVDGDFSGDVVMAANVDFTGLPTSDPLVAGRLWNDSGTMKISAG